MLPRPASALERRITHDVNGDSSFQAPTISSYQKQANNNKRVVCYKRLQRKTFETTSFIPPYGLPTTLRVTNKMNAVYVIGMLFKKFKVFSHSICLPCVNQLFTTDCSNNHIV